jgi:hypothetical protein
MNWTTVKLDPADRLFSLYVRLRDKQCVRCGRKGEGEWGVKGLQASHFQGRRKESVRFDLENVDTLCAGCHRYWGTEHRNEYEAFKLKQLGQKRYDLLILRANTPGHKDRLLQKLAWKKLLKKDWGI